MNDVLADLLAERDALKKQLALVQGHNLTAWNRGHAVGVAGVREILKQVQEASAADAWGNTQLTEALLTAEAERDALRKRVERQDRCLIGLRERMKRYQDQRAALRAELEECRRYVVCLPIRPWNGGWAIKPTHEAADAFWAYWRANGETHKHGYYESTWGAINRALSAALAAQEQK